MNWYKLITPVLLTGIIALCGSCEKSEQANGTLLVAVLRNAAPLPQAVVNLLSDTTGGKASVLIDTKSCDADGEAYFDNLSPGFYFLTANGYSKADQSSVYGTTHIQIYVRKGQNHNTVTIYTEP